MKYVIVVVLFFIKSHNALQILHDTSVNLEALNLTNSEESNSRIRPNKLLIYPGTKWCGVSNIANNDSDYGKFEETDKCCQAHDHCPDLIGAFQSKHGLRNPVFYTRLNCACDETFHDCLKASNDEAGDQVGYIYFNVLGTQCFKEEYPIVKCNRRTFKPVKKCVDYELDTNGEKKYQWFDVPSY